MVLFQQSDELVHLRRVQVDAGGALARLDEARGRARLGDVGHEVEEDEIHVLDFVGAVAHELFGCHARGHVAADAQSALVRLVDDDGHKFRLHRAVNLDLHVAEVGVVIDALPRFFRGRGEHFDGPLEGAGAVDQSGEYDARADLLALLDVLAKLANSSMEFPKSRPVVMPAAMSRKALSGSKCWCMSHKPGSSILPRAVDHLCARWRAAGHCSASTLTMRSPRTVTR